MKMEIFIISLIINMLFAVKSLSQGLLDDVSTLENFKRPSAEYCFHGSFFGFDVRNSFLVKELMTGSLYSSLSFGKNKIPILMEHYGYSSYGNLTFGCGYGRNFGERFGISLRFYYILEHAKNYPSRHSLCFDAGLSCRVAPKILLSAGVYNPFKLRYGLTDGDFIPIIFCLSTIYTPTQKLLTRVMLQKSIPGNWEIGCGFHATPHKLLIISTNASNLRIGAGVTVSLNQFLISASAAWHYRVSVSSEVSGAYLVNFENKLQ